MALYGRVALATGLIWEPLALPVPLAFKLRGQQVRYFVVRPGRPDPIASIELIMGPDPTAPIVMAVTVEVNE